MERDWLSLAGRSSDSSERRLHPGDRVSNTGSHTVSVASRSVSNTLLWVERMRAMRGEGGEKQLAPW